MKPRLDPVAVAPHLVQAMLKLEETVQGAGLEKSLMHLVKTRASQLNGCAFCLHMHTADARAAGESEARLYLLDAWRESSMYTDRERAALEWTEALTLLAQTHAPDAAYEKMKAAFTDAEQVALSLLIGTINTWNRLAVGFRAAHPNDVAQAA
ncbi:MAG TPA: carboxymuconolactone decarboxylase family protein [Gammaproteobacteria bacterium]